MTPTQQQCWDALCTPIKNKAQFISTVKPLYSSSILTGNPSGIHPHYQYEKTSKENVGHIIFTAKAT